MKFSIQRKQLKALSRFSATKDIRYYLCGIHVVQNARGTYLESTNGHILGRLLIDETPDQYFANAWIVNPETKEQEYSAYYEFKVTTKEVIA